MNRREFLVTAAAAQLFTASRLRAADSAVPQVPPFNPSKLRPSDFADADLDMPYNLAYLPRLANSVETDGPDRGFINNLSVWRGAGQLHPYNARNMESILTLAWFYASPRKWNQFYASKALRARLELALEYWCNMQSPDGKFSQDGLEQWSLAATSSAVKFISETLRLLKTGPPITPDLHARVIDCSRKALHATLYDPDLISHGKSFSSQYTSVFAGGAAFLAMIPDATLSARLKEQVEASATDLQSPCGYWYEHDGPDLGCTLSTQYENLQMAYHYWRGTQLGDILVEEDNRFGKWLSYNFLPEPEQHFWVANQGIDTLQRHSIFPAADTPLADRAIIMRAFATPPDRRAEQIRAAREKLEKDWPQVDPLNTGQFEELPPSRFLEREHYDWRPTTEQMAEARGLLRPLNEENFVDQLTDTRLPIVFTYVRRHAYYAAFAAAPKAISEQQRLGLTLVWSPLDGVLLQSQAGGSETAWGTFVAGSLPVEAGGFDAQLSAGNTQVRYPLPGGGLKTVLFMNDRIQVSIQRSGDIVERLPVFDPAVVFSEAEYAMNPAPITVSGPAPASCPTPESGCAPVQGPVPGKTLFEVELHGNGLLEYEIRPHS
jgi:hypothetical protein